ncbi:hypothetical protein JVU11DRAFT_3904 [Chiua virens]|nr:hypothetical protein JVU11DRAFT_3904 [Chiua virens]
MAKEPFTVCVTSTRDVKPVTGLTVLILVKTTSIRIEHERIPNFVVILSQRRQIWKRKTIVIAAEGSHGSNLQPIRAEYVKDVLPECLRPDIPDRLPELLVNTFPVASGRSCQCPASMLSLPYILRIYENKITVAMTRTPPTRGADMFLERRFGGSRWLKRLVITQQASIERSSHSSGRRGRKRDILYALSQLILAG